MKYQTKSAAHNSTSERPNTVPVNSAGSCLKADQGPLGDSFPFSSIIDYYTLIDKISRTAAVLCYQIVRPVISA